MKRITIHNLATSTAQEVFDFIATHLLKQNAKSKQLFSSFNEEKPICQYRTETGNKKKVLKCAAGILIPRRDYDSCYEGLGWSNWLDANSPLIKGERYHDNLITQLQYIHDNVRVHEWREELRNLAVYHDLSRNAIS